MARLTYFIQECPTCGRNIEVPVEYLGLKISCQHCKGHLIAQDPSIAHCQSIGPSSGIYRHVEELLGEQEAVPEENQIAS